MKDNLVPIRFYHEFMKRDWPALPLDGQDALASFLMTLQKRPDSPEIVAKAQRDLEGASLTNSVRGFWCTGE
jgi:hypothetical protein